MLRRLHQATRTFRPPPNANWFPWHGRDLGGTEKVISHCDAAPWNITDRARQAAAMVDAYGLTARQRLGFFDRMVEFAIVDTAWEADDAGVTPDMTSHPVALWAMAWRARSAAWLLRNRTTIEAALNSRS